jgi:hypothetical protein
MPGSRFNVASWYTVPGRGTRARALNQALALFPQAAVRPGQVLMGATSERSRLQQTCCSSMHTLLYDCERSAQDMQTAEGKDGDMQLSSKCE